MPDFQTQKNADAGASPKSGGEPEFPPHALFVKLFLLFFIFALIPALLAVAATARIYTGAAALQISSAPAPTLLASTTGGFAAIILFLLAATLAGAYVVSRYLTKPIHALIEVMRKIVGGDMDARAALNRSDELGHLATFFNTVVAAVRENQQRTADLSAMKTQFVTVAAHQLRTPLSAVKWTLKLLLDGDAGALTTEQKELVRRGYGTNDRMIVLVNDLLNVAQADEGLLGFSFRDTNLIQVIERAIPDIEPEARKRGVTIEFKKPSKDIIIIADPDRLLLVVNNMLDNAVQYGRGRGNVSVAVVERDGLAEVSVADTGIGIPEKDRNKIFTRFFRAPNAVSVQANGSGLGLFIAQNIISHHSGKMWFTSEEGKGSTFYFTVPLKR